MSALCSLLSLKRNSAHLSECSSSSDLEISQLSDRLNKISISSSESLDPKRPKLMDCSAESILETSSSINVARGMLKLPWNKPNWNIQIAHLESTLKVWVRLIEDDGEEVFKKLSEDLNEAMKVEKFCAHIKLQGKYAAEMFGNFFRVQVIKLSRAGDRAHCFFIDIGTKEWLPINKIFQCSESFLDTPPLAFCLSLIGLEHFSESACAQRWMEAYLVDKSLKAMIKSKEYKFTNTRIPSPLKKYTHIRAVLYETDENGQQTNLNDRILSKVCASLPVPALFNKQLVLVKIMHISKVGHIFCHNSEDTKGMKIIREALKTCMVEKNLMNIFTSPPSSTELSDVAGIVLVINPADQLCYRAVIRNILGDKTFTAISCFFVDYGFTRKIQYNHIFAPTVLLKKYPWQAIETQLHGIKNFDTDKLLHLCSILKPQDSAYMEVMEPQVESGVPFVQVYKLVDGSLVGPINDFLEVRTS